MQLVHVQAPVAMHPLVLVTVIVSAAQAVPGDSLRLIGGATRCSGQVQVNVGEWLNVCRSHWGEAEGRVVCRQLGCGDLVSAYANYKDKAPAYPVWSDRVSCTGDETRLMDCGSTNSSDASVDPCPDTFRAAVACHQDDPPNAPESMAVRLVNGTTAHSGRVEVYYNGEWGTVCGQNSWSLTDGQVVCRQLGYVDAVAIRDHYDPFGSGTGTILMSFVDCDGHEEKLGNCSHQGWYRHNCDHYYDAGVVCKVPSDELQIRLADGTTQYEGRVEVHYNGEWGTVCDDGWSLDDAKVVCRQLGFGPALSAGHYGEGQGAILLSDVSCDGSETSIVDCEKPGWYPSTHCRHREDAGAACGVPEEPDVRVRLALGTLESEGRLEVYHNGEWGAVCGTSFTILEADVVCRQLGYRKALQVKQPGTYGSPKLIILDSVECAGTEKQLEDCQSLEWYPKHEDCTLLQTAGIVCDVDLRPETVSSVKVRLTGGPIEREGQVEVLHNGQWGTICASGFNVKAANVVCRQLGYYAATYRSLGEVLSDGTQPLLLDSVNCRTGSEANIANCGPLEWYRHDWHNCQTSETAAVACYGSKVDKDVEIAIRLTNGTQDGNGRVEVYHLGEWGSICGAGLGMNEAQVVCRQLGYKSGEAVKPLGYYGSGEEQINTWALKCTGTEALVEKCLKIEWYDTSKHVCHEEQTAGVLCSLTDSEAPKRSGTPMYAVAVLVLLVVTAVVLVTAAGYCMFLRRSKRNAAATQMRYAVLDKQDNSTAY